jgi:hypothetical protein
MEDVGGHLEMMVAYYTGLDAKEWSDERLITAVAHIWRIRELESKK